MTWNLTQQVADSYSFGDKGLVVRDQFEDDPASQQNRFQSREGGTSPALQVRFG